MYWELTKLEVNQALNAKILAEGGILAGQPMGRFKICPLPPPY